MRDVAEGVLDMTNRFFFISDDDRAQMIRDAGALSIDDLYASVPKSAMIHSSDIGTHLGRPMAEHRLVERMNTIAAKNINATQVSYFIGAGCYNHHIPATVGSIISRSEYMTAYTPYQSEVSQGLLSAMFEFQTIISRLTGMDIANGSMYDGATALAEAVLMSSRINSKKLIYFANNVHPHYRDTVETTVKHSGISTTDLMSDGVSCIIVQQPDFFGEVAQINRELADRHGALLIVVTTEILSLGLLPPPSIADIVVGEAQSLSLQMNFGGPHVGFFACKKQYMRQLPGRVCGETIDINGDRAFTLTISAREQHIKRGKATSNICTNQFLLGLAFTVHTALLGEEGYKKLALINHERCIHIAELIESLGPRFKVLNRSFFNEIAVSLPFDSGNFLKYMLDNGIMAGYNVDNSTILIAVTEMNSIESIEKYAKLMQEYSGI